MEEEYSYIKNKPRTYPNPDLSYNNTEDTINPKYSTSIRDLDLIDNFDEKDIVERISGFEDISVPVDNPFPDQYNMYHAIVPNSEYKMKPKELDFKNKNIRNLLSQIANSYIDIIDDILSGDIKLTTFTKGIRLFAIGILMVVISLFFMFFNQI
jgi:hypothetical protein